MKVVNKRPSLAPDDRTINSRAEAWQNLFTKFSNCNDNNDEGYDMDDLIAMAEEEDRGKFNDYSDKFDPNVEAIEEIYDERIENFPKDNEGRYEKLTLIVSPEFLQKAVKEYQERCEELGKMNLPFWHIKKDERIQEQINHFSDGFSAARNYESNTTAIAPFNSSPDPRQTSTFVSMPSIDPQIFKLPPEIQQIMSNNSVVNFKIREYDLTVCRDPGNASISIKIPTFGLPSVNNIKALPEVAHNDETLQSKLSSVEPPKLINEVPITIDDSDDDQPKSKRFRTDENFVDIKLSEISTAGSSLSTDDDDFYFSGGEARNKQRRLTHKLKKMEKRREERIERMKEEKRITEEKRVRKEKEKLIAEANEKIRIETELAKKKQAEEERIRKENEEKFRAESEEKARLELEAKQRKKKQEEEERKQLEDKIRLELEEKIRAEQEEKAAKEAELLRKQKEEEERKKLEEKIRKEIEAKIRAEQEAKETEEKQKSLQEKNAKEEVQQQGKVEGPRKDSAHNVDPSLKDKTKNIFRLQKKSKTVKNSCEISSTLASNPEIPSSHQSTKIPSNPPKINHNVIDSDSSTPDDDDFMEMVGEAIKKHKEKIMQERKIAEEKRKT